jgi:hypothetical protein
MPRATASLGNRVISEYQALKLLETDLRATGDTEVADAVLRAARELEHPSVTGNLNQLGINSKQIRP